MQHRRFMKIIFTLLISIVTIGSGRTQELFPESYLLLADAYTDPVEAMQINDDFLAPQYFDPVYTLPDKNNRWKLVAISSSCMLISGFCDATSEVLKVKYESFNRVFPNANDQFWD